MTEYFAW